MASSEMTQVVGTTRQWQLTATVDRKPILNTFVPGDTLSAAVWPGGDTAPVFAPTAVWIDPAAATIKLTSPASQAASVAPGLYHLRVTVTPLADSQPRDVHYGLIRFLPSDGSRSLPTSLVSSNDLMTWCSEVSKLQDGDNDLAGFSEQRNRAMGEFVQDVVRRYCPRPGGSRRYVSADGSSPGPYLRFAPSPDGSPPPTREQVRAWLSPGRLVLNEDVIEANARLAAAIIYGTTPGSNNVYQQMSREERRLAKLATDRAAVEIDTKSAPDGTPVIRVDRDVVYLT